MIFGAHGAKLLEDIANIIIEGIEKFPVKDIGKVMKTVGRDIGKLQKESVSNENIKDMGNLLKDKLTDSFNKLLKN